MPWFTWHGFRYFELTNNAEPVRCEVVHSDCAVTSSFESGSEMLNWLYDAYIRTQLSNMHSGVPSDCPHIERLGYTGDGQLCCEAAMMLLDSQKFYKKWLEDISDCQSIGNGHVQHTAPFMGGGGGPAGWGGAIAVVPYEMYKYTATRRPFAVICRRSFDILIISTREAPAVSSAARKRAAGASATGARPNK